MLSNYQIRERRPSSRLKGNESHEIVELRDVHGTLYDNRKEEL